MERKLMLLCEALSIHDEVISYSVGLAKRQNLDLIIMALVSSQGGKDLKAAQEESPAKSLEKWGQDLEELKRRIEGSGVKVETLVRTGDPVSEFLKFMAGGVSLYSIIWGGDEEAIREMGPAFRNHWVHKIKGLVECPWVIPSLRIRGDSKCKLYVSPEGH